MRAYTQLTLWHHGTELSWISVHVGFATILNFCSSKVLQPYRISVYEGFIEFWNFPANLFSSSYRHLMSENQTFNISKPGCEFETFERQRFETSLSDLKFIKLPPHEAKSVLRNHNLLYLCTTFYFYFASFSFVTWNNLLHCSLYNHSLRHSIVT